jgi:hypothetical protein
VKVAVTHFYKLGNDAWSDIIETDRLPEDLRLKFDQAVLMKVTEMQLPEAVMQDAVYKAGGENEFPMMIMGKLTLIGT